ncbi:MAG: type II toxin-antitoxin system VapC family toxin [Gammaproteobacteria bacterium]|nr:type II toxin-antitoxin system VapC family toxin [Gammaproteobacteria bacterium]
MILVVDASVAIKWFLHFLPEEADTPQALKILEQVDAGRIELVQPPHFIAETGAVLARKKPDNGCVQNA